MLTRPSRSLLDLSARCQVIPVIENRVQFAHALDAPQVSVVTLRHCNIFELQMLLERAYRRGLSVYVNIDHIEGIHADFAGLSYLANHFHVLGIISSNPRTLSLGKQIGLETIQRIFAMDSTGLETAIESVDRQIVDLLDISPALVLPYVIPFLVTPLPLPFTASGLIQSDQQIKAALQCGALAVLVTRSELWQ